MFVGAVGLTGAALFLQGCGSGGGSDDVVSCVLPHLDFVSQSISGTMTMSGTMALPPYDFTQKIDLEQFNYWATSSVNAEVPGPTADETLTVKMDATIIVNVAAKHAIEYIEINDPTTGNVSKDCMVFPLPDEMPNPAILKTMFEAMLTAANCSDSDGTYDTWKYSASYDGPVPNGILPIDTTGVSVKGSFDEEITMSASQKLLHSVHSVLNVDMMNNSAVLGTVAQTVDTSISSAEAGGPSAADLDPAQFGVNCTTPEDFDVNTFFTRGAPTNLQKHVVATLRAALRPQPTQIAV